MKRISVSKAREKIYKIMQEVNESSIPITITNSKGKNVVVIGEDDWNAIEETLALASIPGMVESVIEGGNTDIDDCIDELGVGL